MRAPSLAIIPGAALALFVAGLASAQAADKPFTDAVAYCQAAGNADAPDARYAGPAVPDWMVAALYSKDELKAQKKSKVDPARAVVWRCMGGKVLGCVQGNSPICGKAPGDGAEQGPARILRGPAQRGSYSALRDRAREPDGLRLAGRGTKPAIARQIFTVDARGFPSELWKDIAPAKN